MSLYVNIEKHLSSFNLNVNFEHKRGVLGFLGASGSGKSMSLKCISGLVTPSRGKIIVNDKIFLIQRIKLI
ncbi:ABC-type molybdate transport system ATPase subunit [Clostridium beijerinckii]|nr:ABC-type molybdate transport system ATPase subunit [Clostridium beijerinckii]